MTLLAPLVALACSVAFLWRVRCAYGRGYAAGFRAGEAHGLGEAMDAADLICRATMRAIAADEFERMT